MIWRVGAVLIAGLVALPLLGIASSLFAPQRELAQAIKRARFLALLPYVIS